MEMGNSWEKGHPVMSTLTIRALLRFMDAGKFYLCQEFVSYNSARLPSPAQWVNVERIRVKDAFTHVWWMSSSPRPKADNTKVLRAYSVSMQKLIASQTYNHGLRPSEHRIGKTSFLTDNGGSIPSNVLEFPNTSSRDEYLDYCKNHHLRPHPARMPSGLAQFFIEFLTDSGDRVLDPFAGSNTTGVVAERLGRRWASVEIKRDYIEGARGRLHNHQNPSRGSISTLPPASPD
jgi:site-specific DNA-methyltransferase (cytosine-N4-specific)